MSFSLGLLDINGRLSVKSFGSENLISETVIGPEHLSGMDISAIFYRPEELTSELIQIINSKKDQYPISPIMDQYTFERLTPSEAKELLSQATTNWVLKNNLILISDIFKVREHLLSLLHKDRLTFFEELWAILHKNLGTTSLTIIYNGLEKGENSKNHLVLSKIHGHSTPNPLPAEEIDHKLMVEYKAEFGNRFSISEYSKGAGELVATAQIYGGPILLLAKISELTPLQRAIANAIFDGLQE